ncbi:type I toxin-antitoxin system Ibs family toxin [Escherichia coli]|nr:type I toxin-antitoxin system Ibs family toxin [Escherichia coli]
MMKLLIIVVLLVISFRAY